MTATKYLVALLMSALMSACGSRLPDSPNIRYQVDTDFHFPNYSCAVGKAYQEVQNRLYSGIDALYTVGIVTLERVQKYCGANAMACTLPYDGLVLVSGDILPDGSAMTPEYICQQVMHEYHHVVAYRQSGDWDYTETYFSALPAIISEACKDTNNICN